MFTIMLAEHTFCIENRYDYVKKLCEEYIIPDCNAQKIFITDSQLDYEKKLTIGFPNAYLESLAVYRRICELLVDENIILFHGSAVVVDGLAYIFTAASGTGKSTHTSLWRAYLGERATMLNDDKPLLKITSSGVTAYGTPWNGKHRLGSNISAPLKAVCILERSEKNHIKKINKKAAYPMLLQQVYRPKSPVKMAATLNMIDQLAKHSSLYRLCCNMEIDAAELAYNYMKGEAK